MDAEPGRCRRTDGKRWRCRLAVLPDQKYCERHVHRGRQRSRKPVEVDQTSSKSKSKSTTTSPISSLKATTNQDKVPIKNQSVKIKKPSREKPCVSLAFSISPKSVLQHGNGQHCGTSSNALALTESVRCRRTDGKKWRCRKNTLPQQKYCSQHIHRGKKAKNCQKLNTGLSLSITLNDHQMSDDDGTRSNEATSSSSSDATTISI